MAESIQNDMDASTPRSRMIGWNRLRTFRVNISKPRLQRSFSFRSLLLILAAMLASTSGSECSAQRSVPDQHSIRWHSGRDLSLMQRPASPAPVTVTSEDVEQIEHLLPLDEAIRIALNHAEVIRVLGGVSASNSGQNIYETAIATAGIDNAVAAFDPVFQANSNWRKNETPGAGVDPADPLNAIIDTAQTGGNTFTMALRRRNRLGGTAGLQFADVFQYGDIGRLSNNHRPEIELSYTQPLLSGAGRAANEAPIVIAQLNVDRSFFSFKGRVQQMVQGVISAYWSLVAARTELWAREKQVEQALEAFDQVKKQFEVELADIGDVAQPRLALANFRANLISAKANVIQREAALRNLLGLPPEDGQRLVPSTPPTREQLEFQWVNLIESAYHSRPDLIELNLVLLADQQRLIQADNQARPSLNAQAIQSWNGLRGRALNQNRVSSDLNDNPNWTLGFTFEVPLGLRDSRANLRSRELVIARDRANISQGLHQTEHELATTIRSLDQAYAQYQAFKETRAAARINLDVQLEEEDAGRTIFLNVLQAITSWGDAVSAEANALTQYNTSLASLEQATGTILDTHGVFFTEERYASIGRHGRQHEDECYPKSLSPHRNTTRYEVGVQPAEEAFDLHDFDQREDLDEPIPQDGSAPAGLQKMVPPANGPLEGTDEASIGFGGSNGNIFRSASFQNVAENPAAKPTLHRPSTLNAAAKPRRPLATKLKALFRKK